MQQLWPALHQLLRPAHASDATREDDILESSVKTSTQGARPPIALMIHSFEDTQRDTGFWGMYTDRTKESFQKEGASLTAPTSTMPHTQQQHRAFEAVL
jgi:hypothetical protein